MAVTTADVGNYVKPIGMIRGNPWPYGNALVPIKKLKKKKRKNEDNNFLFMDYGNLLIIESFVLEEWENKNVGDDKWKVTPPGKVGKWRTVRGRKMFFPDDGSQPVGGNPNYLSGKSPDMLSKIQSMKGKAKGAVKGVLKKLEKALLSNDQSAFKKASAKLSKITAKLKKKK